MDKRLLLGFLVILTIFAYGCTTGDDDLAKGPFVGGTNGLDFGFVADEPPNEVFANDEEFDIAIFVENVGEFDIPERKVIATLGGLDTRDLGLSGPNKVLEVGLNGKTKSDSEVFSGDEDEIIYEGALYETKYDLVADFSTKVRADICYLYQTKSTTKACLKKKASQRDASDFCLVNNDNVKVENSGAPVQIRDVRTRSSGTSQVTLTFIVENVGSGKVYPPNTFTNECVRKDSDEDRLDVEVRSASGRHTITCSALGGNEGEVRLSNDGKKQIRCSISTGNAPDTPVEEAINILVDYFYRGAISTPITIKSSEF
ncbi:MAG: hypothetical protein ABIB47_01910 [Candidatus Woesearchaeota archaeon]